MKRIYICFILFILPIACSVPVMTSVSPSGEYAVNINENLLSGKFCQSILLIDTVGGVNYPLTNLAEGRELADRIVWSTDSRYAAVLVSYSVIFVIDTGKHGLAGIFDFDPGGKYPLAAHIGDFGFDNGILYYFVENGSNAVRVEEVLE